MKKIRNRLKKKPILIFTLIFFILFLFSSICLIYSILRISNIENLLRYLFSGIAILLVIYFILWLIKIILKGKNPAILLFNIVLVILFVITSYICSCINGVYSSISKIYKEDTVYNINVITKSSSDIESVNDIDNNLIGIISSSAKKEINDISNELINENNLTDNNEIKEYSSFNELISDLYDDKIDIGIVESTYISTYSALDEYEDIATDTKIIASKEKTIKKEDTVNIKNQNEPFTILVLGIDSTVKDISTVTSFNADSIMLITFNPKTYNATILSIPRDTYVNITCNNKESKITHSGWNGESCVVSTIENWMDIDIDYYVKVNFTAVVNLVDALGGIEVDVPYSFCEQNSERKWGDNTVYVKEGLQNLNGEQALALARNRHPNPTKCSSEWTNYYSDDIVRGENQQLVLNALFKKMTNNLNLENIYSILDVIGTNVDTNMKINEITSYYNLVKSIALNTLNNGKQTMNIEKLHLSTYGKSLYDPLLNLAGMSMQIYYNDSFTQVVNEMKTNLEIIQPELIKTFTFSANEEYKKITIGSGSFVQENIKTVPNFIGVDIEEVRTWANENSIELIVEYEENSNVEYNKVISQNIPSTYIISNIENKTIKIVVSNYVEDTTNENIINDVDENNPIDNFIIEQE